MPINFGRLPSRPSVAVADFNGDGKQDLVFADFDYGDVWVLLGDGTGNFGAAVNIASHVSPWTVVVGDFNGDGKPDIAVSNAVANAVSILLGDGAGNFTAPTHFPASNGPLGVVVGDFNRDGKQDLAVTGEIFKFRLDFIGRWGGQLQRENELSCRRGGFVYCCGRL